MNGTEGSENTEYGENGRKPVNRKLLLLHGIMAGIALAAVIALIFLGRGLDLSNLNRRRFISGAVLTGAGWIILFLRFHFLIRVKYRNKGLQAMKRRKFFDRLPLYLLWAVFAVILTIGIYLRLTDAPAEKKLILYIDAPVETELLARRLEQDKPETLRWIVVRDEQASMFYEDSILEADIWIVKASHAERLAGRTTEESVLIYQAQSDSGPAMSYVLYPLFEMTEDGVKQRSEKTEDYYLYYNKDSLHLGGEGSTDDAARIITALYRSLP